MATDFLTFEEVCEFLSRSADEVSAMVADGRLSEIRDGDSVFFKKAEVEQIVKEGSSIVDLALTEDADAEETESFASALSSLADDSSGMGILDQSPAVDDAADVPMAETAEPVPLDIEIPDVDVSPVDLSLAPAEETARAPEAAELSLEDLPEELPAAPPEEVAPVDLGSDLDLSLVEDGSVSPVDTGSGGIPDLGLSGSSIIGLEPSQEDAAAPAEDDTRVSKVGISVFDDDELEAESDPMGETQISSGVAELDNVGSGSGLLDLTRESDDTSLGPELLDVISPSDAAETEADGGIVEVVGAEDTMEDSGPEMTVVEEEEDEEAVGAVAAAPRRAATAMRGAVQINVCLLVGLIGLVLAALATAGEIQGVWPEPLEYIARASDGIVFYSVFGGLALIALVTGILGILADRG
ncbi:MAG: hypothetical protein ABII12_11570 [Planctomycetota bacterium]